MLGPSFSPSMARMPGPTSSHSRCQRRRWGRAVSSSVSCGGRSRGEGAAAAASGVPIHRSSFGGRRLLCGGTVDFDTHSACKLSADGVLALAELHEQRPTEWLALTYGEALAWGNASIGQVAKHLGVRVRHAHEQPGVAGLQALHAIGDALFELELSTGDGVAVGIDGGG